MKVKILPLVATVATLLSIPNIHFAQAPNLGAAGSFIIYTTTGAVGNTSLSQITGNVGTNAGSTTGFGNVNGVMHSNNGTTATAASNLQTAYLQINSTTATGTHAPLLGNGETLNAGVYDIAGQTTLSNTLTLDAKGNANAVFIFRISAVLNSTAASEIKLINNALACNVFWKVEGAVNLASLTQMKGTIIANNGAIDISSGTNLEGRALSTTGAVTVNGVTAKIPIGCGSAVLTGPTAPNLASTACYAIFSGSGPVTNSANSITNVTGDVGTNATLTTGYNPLLVNGSIHPIPDNSTSLASADLLNVRTYLNGLVPDIELLFPAIFGSGLVLTPHTYILNGSTTLTDTVFLNAEGNADAVFVIKVYGAFEAVSLAAVKLINEAQAKNVFWIINGAVSINDYADFKGTIVCNNGAVDLKTGAKLEGRVMTTVGALTTAAVNVAVPTGTCSNLMPVTWLYFRGTPVKESVLLEWGTAKEVNNSFFSVEKSRDGRKFETLTTINAARDNGNIENAYSYTDRRPYTDNYYRISQTDKDGKKTFFSILQVKMNSESFKANAYLQQSFIYVETSGATPGKGMIDLYNIDGKKVSSQQIMLTKEANYYKVAKPLNKGLYLVSIVNGGAKIFSGKVMVP
ncbi:MAG TPA: ice-binding family protein [Segetibacter sp.]